MQPEDPPKILSSEEILKRLERLRIERAKKFSVDPTPPEPPKAEEVQRTNWQIQGEKF